MTAPALAFLDRDALLAVGFTLIVASVVLRGFARSLRRAAALRRQHELHVREHARETPTAAPGHLERHLGRYAIACLGIGAALVTAAFFRS